MKRMNRREWLKWVATSLTSSAVLPTFLTACGEDNEPLPEPAPDEEPDNDEPTGPASQVWMTTDLSAAGLLAVYHAVGRQATGRVAVKISTGEPGGHHYLQPSLIADLVHKVNGTIVECNTAYQGGRSDSTSHWQAIRDHGFLDIANVDLMDEKGEMQLPVQDTTHIQYNLVGSHLANYDFLINLAHFKGHAIAGFGGVLKNQSIGIAPAGERQISTPPDGRRMYRACGTRWHRRTTSPNQWQQRHKAWRSILATAFSTST